MRWNISLSVLAFSSSIESRTKRETAAKSAACVYGVFQSRRRRRRLSHKIPLKAHSLYSAIASHAAPKAFFSPPPSPTPPLSPLFQCIHADLYGLYPPLPSFLPSFRSPSRPQFHTKFLFLNRIPVPLAFPVLIVPPDRRGLSF